MTETPTDFNNTDDYFTAYFSRFPASEPPPSSSSATDPFSSSSATRELSVYLEKYLGERHRGRTESVLLTVVYGAVFLTGLSGNVCTAMVVARKASLRTSTNFYLCSLAVSDILTLVLGLPPELYSVWEAYPWKFGSLYCQLKTFVTEMTSSASILTIAAFTIERFLAVCHPLTAKTMTSNPSRSQKVIAVVWVVACGTALPYPAYTRTYHYLDDPDTGRPLSESLICSIPLEWVARMRPVFQFSTFALFVLPMVLISGLYIRIGAAIRRSGRTLGRPRRREDSGSGAVRGSVQRRSILRMLVAVVVAFFLCWAPFHAQRLLTIYVREDQWTATLLETQSILFYISGVLYFVSCTVNPILYNIMSRRYRQAFRETICVCDRSRCPRSSPLPLPLPSPSIAYSAEIRSRAAVTVTMQLMVKSATTSTF